MPAKSAADVGVQMPQPATKRNGRKFDTTQNNDDLAHVAMVAQKIAKAAVKAFEAAGVTIQQFNEGAGGQVVFHLHVHIIPRKAGTPMKPPASDKEKPDVLAEQAK